MLYIKKESLTVLGQHEGELTTFIFWMSYPFNLVHCLTCSFSAYSFRIKMVWCWSCGLVANA